MALSSARNSQSGDNSGVLKLRVSNDGESDGKGLELTIKADDSIHTFLHSMSKAVGVDRIGSVRIGRSGKPIDVTRLLRAVKSLEKDEKTGARPISVSEFGIRNRDVLYFRPAQPQAQAQVATESHAAANSSAAASAATALANAASFKKLSAFVLSPHHHPPQPPPPSQPAAAAQSIGSSSTALPYKSNAPPPLSIPAGSEHEAMRRKLLDRLSASGSGSGSGSGPGSASASHSSSPHSVRSSPSAAAAAATSVVGWPPAARTSPSPRAAAILRGAAAATGGSNGDAKSVSRPALKNEWFGAGGSGGAAAPTSPLAAERELTPRERWQQLQPGSSSNTSPPRHTPTRHRHRTAAAASASADVAPSTQSIAADAQSELDRLKWLDSRLQSMRATRQHATALSQQLSQLTNRNATAAAAVASGSGASPRASSVTIAAAAARERERERRSHDSALSLSSSAAAIASVASEVSHRHSNAGARPWTPPRDSAPQPPTATSALTSSGRHRKAASAYDAFLAAHARTLHHHRSTSAESFPIGGGGDGDDGAADLQPGAAPTAAASRHSRGRLSPHRTVAAAGSAALRSPGAVAPYHSDGEVDTDNDESAAVPPAGVPNRRSPPHANATPRSTVRHRPAAAAVDSTTSPGAIRVSVPVAPPASIVPSAAAASTATASTSVPAATATATASTPAAGSAAGSGSAAKESDVRDFAQLYSLAQTPAVKTQISSILSSPVPETDKVTAIAALLRGALDVSAASATTTTATSAAAAPSPLAPTHPPAAAPTAAAAAVSTVPPAPTPVAAASAPVVVEASAPSPHATASSASASASGGGEPIPISAAAAARGRLRSRSAGPPALAGVVNGADSDADADGDTDPWDRVGSESDNSPSFQRSTQPPASQSASHAHSLSVSRSTVPPLIPSPRAVVRPRQRPPTTPPPPVYADIPASLTSSTGSNAGSGPASSSLAPLSIPYPRERVARERGSSPSPSNSVPSTPLLRASSLGSAGGSGSNSSSTSPLRSPHPAASSLSASVLPFSLSGTSAVATADVDAKGGIFFVREEEADDEEDGTEPGAGDVAAAAAGNAGSSAAASTAAPRPSRIFSHRSFFHSPNPLSVGPNAGGVGMRHPPSASRHQRRLSGSGGTSRSRSRSHSPSPSISPLSSQSLRFSYPSPPSSPGTGASTGPAAAAGAAAGANNVGSTSAPSSGPPSPRASSPPLPTGVVHQLNSVQHENERRRSLPPRLMRLNPVPLLPSVSTLTASRSSRDAETVAEWSIDEDPDRELDADSVILPTSVSASAAVEPTPAAAPTAAAPPPPPTATAAPAVVQPVRSSGASARPPPPNGSAAALAMSRVDTKHAPIAIASASGSSAGNGQRASGAAAAAASAASAARPSAPAAADDDDWDKDNSAPDDSSSQRDQKSESAQPADAVTRYVQTLSGTAAIRARISPIDTATAAREWKEVMHLLNRHPQPVDTSAMRTEGWRIYLRMSMSTQVHRQRIRQQLSYLRTLHSRMWVSAQAAATADTATATATAPAGAGAGRASESEPEYGLSDIDSKSDAVRAQHEAYLLQRHRIQQRHHQRRADALHRQLHEVRDQLSRLQHQQTNAHAQHWHVRDAQDQAHAHASGSAAAAAVAASAVERVTAAAEQHYGARPPTRRRHVQTTALDGDSERQQYRYSNRGAAMMDDRWDPNASDAEEDADSDGSRAGSDAGYDEVAAAAGHYHERARRVLGMEAEADAAEVGAADDRLDADALEAAEEAADWELRDFTYENLLRLEDVKTAVAPDVFRRLPKRTLTSDEIARFKRNEHADKRRCTICLADFEVADSVLTITCLHVFHTVCITQWLTQKASCPLCRSAVTE